MRILFVSNFYPPHEIGGYAQWCQEVALRMIQGGHIVHILTSRFRKQSVIDTDPDWVTRLLHLQADINYYQPLDFLLNWASKESENIAILKRKISKFQPDIIMIWGMWNLSLNIPYNAEQLMPGRVTYYIASYWPMDENLHGQYWRMPARNWYMNVIKYPLKMLALSKLNNSGYPPELNLENSLCCSQFVRRTLVEANCLPTSARVLLGGIDPKPFIKGNRRSRNRDNSLHLVYFGRLVEAKGVHDAISALNILYKKGLANRVDLTIIGDGHPDYIQRLKSMVGDNGLQDKIRFIKWIPRDEIPRYLKQFDVYLFTSLWPEPMARSVMEAMAGCLLVIGSEVGGQVEMLDNNENALTYKAGDAEALANQILRVINDPHLLERLSKSGRELVLNIFNIDRMVNDIETYLASLV
ncbi:MAG: glycosyltransferase family 4 protein [Anaerolineales bacterium]|jgi:glycosyltransferase involved in cell wall biosynthesis